MARITDPNDALASLQQAVRADQIDLQRGQVDRELYVYRDNPNDIPRFSYARLDGKKVISLVIFARIDPIDETLSFSIGYAVGVDFRQQGRAGEAVLAAISELQFGLGRNGVNSFYVEAVVGADNAASQWVAESTIAAKGNAIIDCVSGQPALRYLKKFG